MSQSPSLLRACQVTKRYPGTVALDAVDFELRRGEVHVLIGENGAGKSTLVKLLAGVEQPTMGHLELEGREIRLGSTRDAAAAGIGMIYQELSLFPNLSVVENIFMACERTRGGVIDRKSEEGIARGLMKKLEQDIDVHTLVGDLPLGCQQIVEICRALARNVRVLLMDEPTSALSPNEIAVLFRVIRELKAAGVGIVYISHKLEELMEIGDRVTVLRDGRLVESAAIAEVDVAWIIDRMTDRRWAASAQHAECAGDAEVLRVEHLSVPGRVHDVSLSVCAGELVGVYGLMGAGRTELLEVLAGNRAGSGGRISLAGRSLEHLSVRERIAAGLALVPEDRQAAGLIPTFSVGRNMTLASLSAHSSHGLLRRTEEAASASRMIAQLRIKTTGQDQPITSLSGGNQQKAVISKYLLTKPRVLLMDEPSRGVDVGARAEIFEIARKLAAEGVAILFASSDLHEVLTLADRVLVMARGRLSASFERSELNEQNLMAAACAKPENLHVNAQ
ncbi:sugar ABC transporter ATP-binding protein [Paludibaculum fermentans]|uniref:Sugar ABC transporter ATP-binding protein n=1 Tax=Paludibaculum fermentans TaxID=1473598 RepID=A0A7S7SL99_PALFE|nr:sugar ABC transporter ATP-binding protein [Paludibaculum fermentans]QOY88598.1 sugar ABC transporter ATP-binding protein [Paludibaculum fermentans]